MILKAVRSGPVRAAYRAAMSMINLRHRNDPVVEMLGYVFMDDDTEILIATDGWRLVGGISYQHRVDHIHVFALASTMKGVGSALMQSIENLCLPVTLMPLSNSAPFYLKRGYTYNKEEDLMKWNPNL